MSSIAWGIMALALAGADAPEAPARTTFSVRHVGAGGNLPIVERVTTDLAIVGAEPEQISYEVRVVDTPAAEWREAFYRHCTRVDREGRSTIWTVDGKTAAQLLGRAQATARSRIVQAPKVTAFAGDSATIDTRHRRAFVVDVDRLEGGTAGMLVDGFRPSVEEINEGLLVSVAGRRTTKGVRTRMKFDSTWVGHVAKARTRESVASQGFGTASIEADVQLPQVVEAKVEGDYEIPLDHHLLVSLGTATSVDERDRPVVMERLLLVAARPIVTEAEEVRIDRKTADKAAARTAWVPAHGKPPFISNEEYAAVMASVDKAPAPMPMRMPPLPSRTPMQPIGPDGKVVELPPLPDEFVAEAEAVDKASGPKASPQAPAARPSSRIDPSLIPARLEPAPVGRSMLRLDGAELASGRTQLIRIPLGGRIAIEVKARLVPAEQPE